MTELSRITFRMPVDVKAWLAQRSDRNCSSLNSEIIRAIRNQMDAEKNG
jgi:hypothetical protein